MKLLFENWRQYKNELLLEDSRGSIKRIVGLPGWIADYLHEESPKYSFTLAKLWLDGTVKRLNIGGAFSPEEGSIDAKAIKAYIKNSVDPDIEPRGAGRDMLRLLNDFFDERYGIRHMGDDSASEYMALGYHTLELLNKYPQLEKELKNSTRAWELIIEKKEEEKLAKETKRDALMTFPDGFYWTDLGTDCSKYEEEEMQHCGADSRGNLVSLRDKNHKPHVTMTVDITGERTATTDTTDYRGNDLWGARDSDSPEWMAPDVLQIKGKQNAPPDKKYWSYIVDFFEKYKPKMHDDEIKMKSKELYRQLVPGVAIKEGDFVRILDPRSRDVRAIGIQLRNDYLDAWDKLGGKVLKVAKVVARRGGAALAAVLTGAEIEHLPLNEKLIPAEWLEKVRWGSGVDWERLEGMFDVAQDVEINERLALQENRIRIRVRRRR